MELRRICFSKDGAGSIKKVEKPPMSESISKQSRRVANLIQILEKSSYPEDRIDAAKVLGRMREKSAVPALVKIIERCRSATTLRHCLNALEEIGDSSAAPAVQRLLGKWCDEDPKNPYVIASFNWRAHALKALRKFGEPSSVPIVVATLEKEISLYKKYKQHYRNGDLEEAVDSAAHCLLNLGGSGILALKEMMKKEDGLIRKHAPFAMFEMGDKKGIEKIKRRLDSGLRSERIMTAVRLKSRAGIETLEECLEAMGDEHPIERKIEAMALGELGGEVELEVISVSLVGDGNLEVVYECAQQLTKFGEKGEAILLRNLGNENSMIRAVSAIALARLDNIACIPVLEELIQDDNRHMARCLNNSNLYKIELSGEIAKRLFESTRRLFILERAISSGDLDIEYGMPRLFSMLSSDSQAEKGRAAKILGRMMCKDAVPELIAALGSANRETSVAIVTALGNIESEQARDALFELVDNKKGIVRGAAIDAIRNMDALVAVPFYLKAFVQNDKETRSMVTKALKEMIDECSTKDELAYFLVSWDRGIIGIQNTEYSGDMTSIIMEIFIKKMMKEMDRKMKEM